jgi:hypothetical protein
MQGGVISIINFTELQTRVLLREMFNNLLVVTMKSCVMESIAMC